MDKSVIPNGDYCYKIIGRYDSGIKIKQCPYWSIREDKPYQMNGYCSFIRHGDWEVNGTSLLWDMVKECNVNDYEESYN